jgi:hypothetical protein
MADQIGAIRDLVTKAPAAWSVEQVAGAFRGASRADVEEVLDSLAALGAGYEAGGRDAGSSPARRRRRLPRRRRHKAKSGLSGSLKDVFSRFTTMASF